MYYFSHCHGQEQMKVSILTELQAKLADLEIRRLAK
jgi:hypothetical protein